MQQLALKIKKGDEQAFQTFFNQTHHAVLRYLNKQLPDNRFIDDIIQEVYIRVWQNRLQIDPERSLEGWLFTIVYTTMVNHLQKLVAEKKRINSLTWAMGPAPPADHNKGPVQLLQKESDLLYHHALQSIKPAQRQRCFRLHREAGLTYHQIADLEGLAVKTVEGHISAALKELRKLVSLTHCVFFFFSLF
ncbi:RNA polymerase sigma factor [Pseudoflavitalea rhizosphaerae]|uniref:RNA polymerase sigma factor n=1 Tax=Pseudoflavitalea rhizosphaerae TaxID=1884793 RepID=UPI000F8D4ED9|nr:sigma-70 family RNA polymerase sigma factor [Pseudoflavitalea rhizosphaerae]